MIDKQYMINIMEQRGFTPSSYGGNTVINFISKEIHDINNNPRRHPIINIRVWLDSEEFQGIYCVGTSINTIQTPKCGSILLDDHFDRIIMKLEDQARIMELYYYKEEQTNDNL